MTTISASRAGIGVTPFEGMLLHAASALDSFVAARLRRRGGGEYRRAAVMQSAAEVVRVAAQARGAIGILPR